MQVLGVCRRREARGRAALFTTLASALFEAQLARAATHPRRYVIDQSGHAPPAPPLPRFPRVRLRLSYPYRSHC